MSKIVCYSRTEQKTAIVDPRAKAALSGEYLPMLTWADWELLQWLHAERAAPAGPDVSIPPKPYSEHLECQVNGLHEQLKQAAAERDRALVQVTVYRKAYYNLLQALSTGPSMQAMLDAVRIIDAAVKDHENQ